MYEEHCSSVITCLLETCVGKVWVELLSNYFLHFGRNFRASLDIAITNLRPIFTVV